MFNLFLYKCCLDLTNYKIYNLTNKSSLTSKKPSLVLLNLLYNTAKKRVCPKESSLKLRLINIYSCHDTEKLLNQYHINPTYHLKVLTVH